MAVGAWSCALGCVCVRAHSSAAATAASASASRCVGTSIGLCLCALQCCHASGITYARTADCLRSTFACSWTGTTEYDDALLIIVANMSRRAGRPRPREGVHCGKPCVCRRTSGLFTYLPMGVSPAPACLHCYAAACRKRQDVLRCRCWSLPPPPPANAPAAGRAWRLAVARNVGQPQLPIYTHAVQHMLPCIPTMPPCLSWPRAAPDCARPTPGHPETPQTHTHSTMSLRIIIMCPSCQQLLMEPGQGELEQTVDKLMRGRWIRLENEMNASHPCVHL